MTDSASEAVAPCLVTQDGLERGRKQQPMRLAGLASELQNVTRNIDPITNRVAFVSSVRLLKEIRDVLQYLRRREGKILPEDCQFFFPFGKVNQDLWLEARMDVLGEIECGRVVIHSGHQAEIRVSLDFDAGDDRFHVAAIIEKGSQAGPTLLAHPI